MIGPNGISLAERGKGTNTRYIFPIAMEERDVADSLLVTEVFPPRATGRPIRRTGMTRITIRI